MDYPKTVENFLLAYPEFKDFSEAITAYSLFIESRNNERCYVCKATLTPHECLTLTPYDFQITCGRHRHLKNIFNLQAYCHQNKSPESVEGVAEIFDKRISSFVAESKEDEARKVVNELKQEIDFYQHTINRFIAVFNTYKNLLKPA